MMKVCGIVIKASEMISVVLQGNPDKYSVVPTSFDKFKLSDSKDQSEVKKFRAEVLEFFDYEKFHAIGIKERITKGRFAAGPISFKIEGLIQTTDHPVHIIHSNSIKTQTKNKIIRSEEVKKYQEDALLTAFYLLHNQ